MLLRIATITWLWVITTVALLWRIATVTWLLGIATVTLLWRIAVALLRGMLAVARRTM
jgi:hypothetical protein